MFIIFRLIEFSFSSIIWGVISSLICVLLLDMVLRGLWRKAEYVPLTYVSWVVLFLVLTFHITMIFGGMKVKSLVDEVQASAETMISTIVKPNGEQLEAGVNEVTKRICDEYPMLTPYLKDKKQDISSIEALPASIGNTVRSGINGFILRRVLWSVAFMVLCFFVAAKSINTAGGRTRSYNRYNRPAGSRTSGHFKRTGSRHIRRTR